MQAHVLSVSGYEIEMKELIEYIEKNISLSNDIVKDLKAIIIEKNVEKGEIVVSMLMRAFTFKKDLMYEHFNESYIESDIYPKATLEGKINDFELTDSQTKLIKGTITIHGISKEVEIKTNIEKTQEGYKITGDFNLTVKDFNIKIPPILSKNIAKVVNIKINFQYIPYED